MSFYKQPRRRILGGGTPTMSSEPLGTDKHEVPKGMNELDSTMPPGHLQGDLTRDLPVPW